MLSYNILIPKRFFLCLVCVIRPKRHIGLMVILSHLYFNIYIRSIPLSRLQQTGSIPLREDGLQLTARSKSTKVQINFMSSSVPFLPLYNARDRKRCTMNRQAYEKLVAKEIKGNVLPPEVKHQL